MDIITSDYKEATNAHMPKECPLFFALRRCYPGYNFLVMSNFISLINPKTGEEVKKWQLKGWTEEVRIYQIMRREYTLYADIQADIQRAKVGEEIPSKHVILKSPY